MNPVLRRWSTVCYAAVVSLLYPFRALGQEEAVALDTGNTAWMLVSCALVLLMVPGLALFYGGLTRTRNVLSTMMHSFVAMGIFGVQWVVVGFALTFGTAALIPGILGWSW
ncbi:MAG: ammonium transporter, partial [Candidatus Latescibacteria bacterium]|nr:ammonium transporter [Candidatus Latescibacterota bacterium]